MKLPPFFRPALLAATGLGLLLTACGGGGDGTLASVSNVVATNVAYGQTTTVTVTGEGLSSNLQATIEPGCPSMTRGSTSSTSVAFTCRLNALGDLRVRVRNAEGAELATARLTVQAPRVSMTLQQGNNTGTFVIELDVPKAQSTVDNFLVYVNTSGCWYTNKLFHRVIKDFAAQGGGFIAGLAPAAGVGPAIKLASNNGLSNVKYSVAMARTAEPDSATSQFFINLKDNPDLDYKDAENPGYAVFGQVVSGFNVVDEFQNVAVMTKSNEAGTVFQNAPIDNVVIAACRQTR